MRSWLALFAVLCACGGNAPQKPSPRLNRWGKPLAVRPVPDWVDKLPQSSRTRVVAVGRSGPTFWPQDALSNAREDARGKVALQLAAHVERYGAASDASGRAARAVDIDKEATDVLLRNARIEATWVDEAGDRDEPGSVWALAVLELDAQGRPFQPATGAPRNGNAMPAWLERLPSAGSKVCRFQAYQLLVQDATGLSVDDFSHTDDPDEAFKQLVRKSARVDQVWVDEDGIRPGDPPGSAWALAVIEVPTTKGSYTSVENPDLGPALDQQGNVPQDQPTSVPANAADQPSLKP